MADVFRGRQQWLADRTTNLFAQDSDGARTTKIALSDISNELQIELPQPSGIPSGQRCAKTANITLQAMIRYAIEDMKQHNGKIIPLAGSCGAFPGPFRKLKSDRDKVIYRIERMLSLRRNFTATQIAGHTAKLLNSHISTFISRHAHIESHGVAGGVNLEELDPTLEQISSELTGLMVPLRALVPQTGASQTGKTKLRNDAVPPVSKKSVPPTPSEHSTKAQITLQPMPRKISNARTVYHRSGKDFAGRLMNAAKGHCNVASYTRAVTREYRTHDPDANGGCGDYKAASTTFLEISPPDRYTTLASIVAKKSPSTITLEFVRPLQEEISVRKIVDDWVKQLPVDDPRRDEAKTVAHERFRNILQDTLDILAAILKKTDFDVGLRLTMIGTSVTAMNFHKSVSKRCSFGPIGDGDKA